MHLNIKFSNANFFKFIFTFMWNSDCTLEWWSKIRKHSFYAYFWLIILISELKLNGSKVIGHQNNCHKEDKTYKPSRIHKTSHYKMFSTENKTRTCTCKHHSKKNLSQYMKLLAWNGYKNWYAWFTCWFNYSLRPGAINSHICCVDEVPPIMHI